MTAAVQRCRRRFLRFFPNGFTDDTYLDWERNYKAEAHERWRSEPIVTVFPFLAQPHRHIFLKPNVTRVAAAQYGFDLPYQSRPNWQTYASLLELADLVQADLRDLHPRDMIDVQSFLWVQGSDEYRGRTFQAAQTTSLRRAS